MNVLEIIELRDKLKAELEVVEKFLEIAKSHGFNGASVTSASAADSLATAIRVVAGQRESSASEKNYGTITSTVREAIRLAPKRFTIRHLFDILRKLGKPLSKVQIATVLNRLVKKRDIRPAKTGKGNRPTIFRQCTTEVSTPQ